MSSSEGPTTLALFDPTPSTITVAELETSTSEESSDTTGAVATTTTETTSTTETTTTTAPTSTTETTSAPTTTVVDYSEYCAAAGSVTALGTFTGFGDPAATEEYFTALAAAWADAAAVAPAVISSDVATVASFGSGLLALLADNAYDITAVIAEADALEQSSGSDDAKIVVDQFSFISCGAEPPLPQQEVALFYASLLDTTEQRAVLAELLSGEEIFDLAGATCFVDAATPDIMFPFAGAPSTPGQDAALAQVLSACQLSIGGQ